jgi:hypothetical protein
MGQLAVEQLLAFIEREGAEAGDYVDLATTLAENVIGE